MNWLGRFYILYGNIQKLVGKPIVNFANTGRAATLPAPLVPPALLFGQPPKELTAKTVKNI